MFEYALCLKVDLDGHIAPCFVSMTKMSVGKSFWGRNHCKKHGKLEVEYPISPSEASFSPDSLSTLYAISPEGVVEINTLPAAEDVLVMVTYAEFLLVFKQESLCVRVRISDHGYDSEDISYDMIGLAKSQLPKY